MKRRSNANIVITISKETQVVAFDPAASSALFQKSEELLTVEAVCQCTEYCPLADTIMHGED
jgi:hypothetical protein